MGGEMHPELATVGERDRRGGRCDRVPFRTERDQVRAVVWGQRQELNGLPHKGYGVDDRLAQFSCSLQSRIHFCII
jgi:hypothetical protein